MEVTLMLSSIEQGFFKTTDQPTTYYRPPTNRPTDTDQPTTNQPTTDQ